MSEVRMLRVVDVVAITRLSRTRIYELEQAGRFPRRRVLSDRAVAWRSDEIAAWIESRPVADDVRAAVP